jgi:predicted DNA-binding transcriptional regulator YafY
MIAAGETAQHGTGPITIGGPVRYEKADTILRIALDMQGTAEELSLEDIQQRYSDTPLSRRTAERLRDAIERVFPQMQQANPGELPKRWRLPAGTATGFAAVSAEELADLAAGVVLLRRESMLVQAGNAERAVSKLRALMRPEALMRVAPDLEALTEAEGIATRPGPRPRIDPDVVVALRQAILANRKVKLHYKYRGSGKTGYETVQPYGFIYGNRHYLVAWSENEKARDFRNFALSNIERVELLEKSFNSKRGFSLQEYAERSFGVFQEEPFDVVWKFSPEVAADAREYGFHPLQKFEDQTDGSLIVRFRAGGALEMCWHLFTWGGHVTILAPKQLSTLLTEHIRKAAAANAAISRNRLTNFVERTDPKTELSDD